MYEYAMHLPSATLYCAEMPKHRGAGAEEGHGPLLAGRTRLPSKDCAWHPLKRLLSAHFPALLPFVFLLFLTLSVAENTVQLIGGVVLHVEAEKQL